MGQQTIDPSERRCGGRASTHGSVYLHGHAAGRGRVIDISLHGLRFRPEDATPIPHPGDVVDLEIRLDGRRGAWWRMWGRVERVAADATVIVTLPAVPPGFEDEVQDQLLAVIERASTSRVLVVDADEVRRAPLIARLRARGCVVDAVATPLEAIACIGEPQTRPTIVLIADTIPATVADDLRAFLAASDGSNTLVIA